MSTIRLDRNETPFWLGEEWRECLLKKLGSSEFYSYPCEAWQESIERSTESQCGLPDQSLFFTYGATGAISYFFNRFVSQTEQVALFENDFYLYRKEASFLNANVFVLRSVEDALQADERTKRLPLVFSDPCNPTGQAMPTSDLEYLLSIWKGPVLLDLTYHWFREENPWATLPFLCSRENVWLALSFSKIFALAGMRLGAVVVPAGTRSLARTELPRFRSNILGLCAAETLIERHSWKMVDKFRSSFHAEKKRQKKDIEAIFLGDKNVSLANTQTNFHVIRGLRDSEAVVRCLASDGIIVKAIGPRSLRIGFAAPEMFNRVCRSLESIQVM